ncbi:uncharacterized protein LOC144660530 [Oculina patagonica]
MADRGSRGKLFPRRNPPPADNNALMEPWFKHRYLVYLQRVEQGGTVGSLCSCTLGIQQNVYNQLPPAQQAQIADMFRSAEGAWAADGPQQGFASPQTGGGGRPVFPVLLNESPHQGDRVIKPFARSDTRGTFCLSTGGTRRLVAQPYATAQFYSGHTPDDGGEMWPIFLVFADIRDAH